MSVDRKENEKRFCRKCLIRDIPDNEYMRSLDIYVQQISPEIKTPEELYQERLSICKECDHLMQGMCRICGCFVEVRAAVTNNYCPNVDPKW